MSKVFAFILTILIVYSIQNDHCLEKTDGVCTSCELGYYLDKSSDNVCIDSYLVAKFHNCLETNDGISCSTCNDGYFFSKNGECVNTKNCKKSQKRLSYCEECDEGFYLLNNGLFCASTQNCVYGDRETGKCTDCESGFYLDVNDNQCKSNQENNIFKNCKKGGEKCNECIYGYYLGEDNICSLSRNCSNSDQDGKCTKCQEGYYLSTYDNKCTIVENCLKADYKFECEECQKYILLNDSKCVTIDAWEISKFSNCKKTDRTGVYCAECKENYYLNQKNNFCVLNIYMKNFKNCAKSDISGEYCEECQNGFYLGTEDKICTSTYGCASSENGVCQKCKYSFCLNGDNRCVSNTNYQKPVYYKCKKTNNVDSECVLCEDGYFLENGQCFDTLNCKLRPFGNCVECKNHFCLSNVYGCLNTNVDNCERCDSDDINQCTGCKSGYRLDEAKNVCVKCKEGCATCSNDNNCGYCDEGYFVKKRESKNEEYDAECGKCTEGCGECYDENSCISCREGFYVVRGNKKEENIVCGECSEGCVECDGPNNCLRCGEGYYLNASGNSKFCLKLK